MDMKKAMEYEETNLKLIQAFKKIVSNGNKITVPSLCKEANIHEQTFYKHFPSKDLFIEYAITVRLENFYETNKELSLPIFLELVIEACYNEKGHSSSNIQDPFVKEKVYIELEKIIKKKLNTTIFNNKNEGVIDFLAGGIIFYILNLMKFNLNSDEYRKSKQELLDITSKISSII